MCESKKREDTKKKVLFVATVVKTHIMEFHLPYLQMLKDMGYETAVASRNDYANPEDCKIPYCDAFYEIPFERSPLKVSNIKAYKALKKVIDEGGYDIIHCHTPVGAMLARLAARKARKEGTRVIYTAHGFHFYKGAPLINWLLYYPVEKFLARYTDVLITINKEDYSRAQRFRAGKVCYVPGVGVDTARFQVRENSQENKRKTLGLKESDFILLSVGELIARKNHSAVLEAIARIKELEIYEKIKYVICGQGVLQKTLQEVAKQLKIEDKVCFLGYRKDIDEICRCSDIFIFPSHQEGLSVALMEAMACGLPIICSNIRGNTDLIEDGVCGCVVTPEPEPIAEAIERLTASPDMCAEYAAAAVEKIKMFDLANVKESYKEIYLAQ